MNASWLSTLSFVGIGFVFGLKHALDADHLAAVSTIVSERRSLWHSSLVGALWGVGHTTALLFAGLAVIVLRVEISPAVARGLETGVAIMLIVLGLNALRRLAAGGRLEMHVHTHGDRTHVHPHIHDAASPPASPHPVGFAMRPLLIGLVHGAAGSAALMLLVLTTIPSTLGRIGYIAAFGVGSIGAMVIMSALLGLPARLTAGRFRRAYLAVQVLAACFSLGLGCAMAYQLHAAV